MTRHACEGLVTKENKIRSCARCNGSGDRVVSLADPARSLGPWERAEFMGVPSAAGLGRLTVRDGRTKVRASGCARSCRTSPGKGIDLFKLRPTTVKGTDVQHSNSKSNLKSSTNLKLFIMLNVFLLSLAGLIGLWILHTLHIAFYKGIRDVPGPWQAKYSILYRVSLVIKGRAVEEYQRLHQKYGAIVRVGPRHVSINDPSAIPQIYGISSRFRKVRPTILCHSALSCQF